MWIQRIVSAGVSGAGWLILGLASSVSLVGCGGSGAQTSGEHTGRIAFTVNRAGWSEIWVMDEDGRNRSRLTKRSKAGVDASGSTSPAWSPDGKLIAYSSSGEATDEDQRDLEIYVMRDDGRENRRLTNDRIADSSPAWSPDGKTIAFSHAPGLGVEGVSPKSVIMLMNSDGVNRTQLTRHAGSPRPVFDSHPAWSPDGTLIAFDRARFTTDGSVRTSIYTIDPTGGRERLLIENAFDPSWSPDGRSIAFTSTRDRYGETCFQECGPNAEIYVARADGSRARRLTASEAADQSPTWAPNSQRLVLSSDRSDRKNHEHELYVIAVDGTGPRRLTTNDVWDGEPDWR